MNEGAALVAAILNQPEDTTLRLAYADWLEENQTIQECPACNGTGAVSRRNWRSFRNETIRCQACEDGRLSDGRTVRAWYIRDRIAQSGGQPRFPSDYNIGARGRHRALACPWVQTNWCKSLDHWDDKWGFVEFVSCDVMAWIRNAKEMLADQPIRRVEIIGGDSGVWNVWGASSYLHQCRGVTDYGRTNSPFLPLQVLLLADVVHATNGPPTNGNVVGRGNVPHQVNQMCLANAIRYIWPRIEFQFPPDWAAHQPNRAPA